MGIKEGEKREGGQDAGRLRAALAEQRGLRAWPPAHRKMQWWGPKSRFLTTLLVPKTAFPPAAALWTGVSMLAVQ